MAAFNKFNSFVLDLATKVHNLNSDTLKIMLTDVAPVATNTIKANITDITAANGYVAGGAAATFVSGADTAGTYKLVLGQPTFTASGGSIAQFRYAVLYNSTAASGNLIGWWDNGAEVNITSGNSFQVQTDQTNGVLQLA
jgi:ABC-type transporter MlaC component